MMDPSDDIYISIYLEYIESYLDDYYTSTIRSRGRSIAKKDVIKYDQISFEEGLIEATVKGTARRPYELFLSLLVDEDIFQIIDIECDCPYGGDCKHQVAVLYDLSKKLKDRLQNSNKVEKIKLKAYDTAVYRKIDTAISNYDILHDHTSNTNRQALSYWLGCRAVFESPNILRLYTFKRADMYSPSRSGENMSVYIKYEDNQLWYKCGSCSRKIKGFCQHQFMIMNEMLSFLSKPEFVAWSWDLDKMKEELAKDLDVATEAMDKHFLMYFDARGRFLAEAKETFITKNQWKDIYKKVIIQKEKNRDKEDEIIIQNVEEAANIETLFWNLGADGNEVLLKVLLGPKLKTKSGITIMKSYFETTRKGVQFSRYDFINELNLLSKNSGDFEQIASLLTDNFDWFKEKIHYLNTDYEGYGMLRKSQIQEVGFKNNKIEANFEISFDEGVYRVERKLTYGDKTFVQADIMAMDTFFTVAKREILLNPGPLFAEYGSLFRHGDTFILPKPSPVELKMLVSGLEKIGTVKIDKKLMPKEKHFENPTFQIKLREVQGAVLFEPWLKVDDYEIDIYRAAPIKKGRTLLTPRPEDINYLHEYLKNAHPHFGAYSLNQFYYLPVKELLKKNWFINFAEECRAMNIDLLGEKDLKGFKYSTHRAKHNTSIKSGIDWFEVDMSLSFGKEKVPTKSWVSALKNGENFVSLKDGSLGLLPEDWLARAKNIVAVADIEKDDIKISHYKFNVVDTLFEDMDNSDITAFISERKSSLEKCQLNKTYTVPKKVKATLRDYQYHGYNWLRFLNESRFGGILADDMGLGKTVQVITMLATLKKSCNSLIIVPKSLLFNWANELDKFCPNITYCTHHGAKREKELARILDYQVILTTYDTASSDIELLKENTFEYIVLDESQAIKNIQSKRYKAMRLLESKHKLAMTGTPIENNTFDLYAQLSFTSPGLLNSPTHFKRNFSDPIDGKGDAEAATLLRKMVHPFILRRTKEQVATELPSKTVSTLYCEMGPNQRKLYDTLKEEIKSDIYSSIKEDGLAKSRFKILDGLLRLRQMCNSALLVNPNFKGVKKESVKIKLLMENLEDSLGSHSALVFSQFTSLLSIIRKELDAKKIKYAYLDGKTRDREAEVNKFMNNDDVKLFLISIKAGNSGLNLTKADYVYIVDPWWNPAVEAQAIDRTHRIGQKKNIFAYKLICKDTIEEKILQLQEKKKGIANDVIQIDEKVVKKLSKKELMSLFD